MLTNGQIRDPAELWSSHLKHLDAPANAKLNPLYHTGPPCTCLLCHALSPDGTFPDIVQRSRSLLERGAVKDAHDWLVGIRGVGPKIASFFLRDLATWHALTPGGDRALLQPIDVWVRRAVAEITAVQMNDRATAEWIVEHSSRPEAFNQGVWFFAAVVAGSEVRLRQALADHAVAVNLLERYVQRLKRAAQAWPPPR